MKLILLSLFSLLLFSCNSQSDVMVEDTSSSELSKMDVDSIYTVVEEMPHFLACKDKPLAEQKACANQKMLQYLFKYMELNPIAKENGIEGTVVVSFVVEKDGTLSNIEVIRGTGITNIVEVLEEMPKWKPGIHKGKARRVRYNLPIKIRPE